MHHVSIIIGGVFVAVLAGCSSGESDDDSASREPVSASTSEQSASPSPSPVTTEGECPHLSEAFIENTVGQRIASTMVTSTRPYASCSFLRPDQRPAAEITFSEHETDIDAQQAALDTTTMEANPVDLGDYGASRVTSDGAVLAFTTGKVLVVIEINQQSSFQAVEIGRELITKL